MSPPTSRLCHHAAFHATKAVAPRFVHKSVHNAARGNRSAHAGRSSSRRDNLDRVSVTPHPWRTARTAHARDVKSLARKSLRPFAYPHSRMNCSVSRSRLMPATVGQQLTASLTASTSLVVSAGRPLSFPVLSRMVRKPICAVQWLFLWSVDQGFECPQLHHISAGQLPEN
jgi:hypothetical protein